jgi:hypothetical protein
MNTLENYFWKVPKQLKVYKWHHYFEIYDNHFKRFRGKKPKILEVGIFKGGSLEMWNHYFEGECEIYGADVNNDCKQYESFFKNVEIFIGNQSSRDFWKEFKVSVPYVDILIDDGGHTMEQQIITFEEMYPHVSPDGVYLCEDTHTSYWEEFGGGLRKPSTFIEYSKNFIDKINSYHIRNSNHRDLNFKHSTNSIHFYDSIVVLEKKVNLNEPIATVR